MEDDEIDEYEQPIVCPMTGSYCSGDLSYLCEDYGCARKVGCSPHSEYDRLSEWEF